LNHSVGVRTGFPLIGYRSVAQDVILMVEAANRAAALVTDRDEPLDRTTCSRVETVATELETLADRTRTAIGARSDESITAAREALLAFEEACDICQHHIETELPEPLLELQQVVTTLRQSGVHAADSLDVATHFAFRESVE